MTAEDALKHEEVTMGRACTLLNHAHLVGGVLTLVYEVDPVEGFPGSGEVRVATYIGERPAYSTIVRTPAKTGAG